MSQANKFSLMDIKTIVPADRLNEVSMSHITGGVEASIMGCSCQGGNTNKNGGNCNCGSGNRNKAKRSTRQTLR